MMLGVDDALQLYHGFLLARVNAVYFGRRLANGAGVFAAVPAFVPRNRQRIGDCALGKRVFVLGHSAPVTLAAQIKKESAAARLDTNRQAATHPLACSPLGSVNEYSFGIVVGATLDLVATMDAAVETRLAQKDDGLSRATVWSSFKSTASLTVIGSSLPDGSYVGDVDASFTTGWHHGDSRSSQGDLLQFPNITFDINGKSVQISNLIARFADNQFQGTGDILPKPFPAIDATWMTAVIRTTSPREQITGTGVSGFAIGVPEPSSTRLAICGIALVGAALRRRK